MWLITVLIIVACLIILYFTLIHNSEFHDDKTGRWYKYAKRTDNPRRACCPICKADILKKEYRERPMVVPSMPLVYSTNRGKRRYGVCCKKHDVVWLDIECKEER